MLPALAWPSLLHEPAPLPLFIKFIKFHEKVGVLARVPPLLLPRGSQASCFSPAACFHAGPLRSAPVRLPLGFSYTFCTLLLSSTLWCTLLRPYTFCTLLLSSTLCTLLRSGTFCTLLLSSTLCTLLGCCTLGVGPGLSLHTIRSTPGVIPSLLRSNGLNVVLLDQNEACCQVHHFSPFPVWILH
jgi:hypothetical protein